MQTIFEAANHIAQEIERTRQHLANLEQALEGLRPLITLDAATTALPYTATTRTQHIEDVSFVHAQVSADEIIKPKRVTKTKPRKRAKPAKLPSTGTELWLSCLARKKLSLGELVDEALKKLDLDETARDVITNRAGAWLYAAINKGVLIPAGTRDGHKLYKRVPSKGN
ncbi:MAG TPA: hypothetical protein DCP03_16205 [Polaromonas sp.]|uniref:hypothetical protein n=1 Tax=Polaromonas sp. UBA4122 TaxID=1947074 RepID=UPI000ED6AC5B|nr:hypothetical protein [Polaromonas sp. UBA4122]HAL39560.1 hypothetical protein [Polaromonas sp.]